MIRRHGLRPRLLLVVLALVAAVSVGCDAGTGGPPSGPIDGHPTTLAGSTWLVTSIGGAPITIGDGPTIAFAETEVRGSGGCNHLGGEYRYDPGSGLLEFGNLGMTAMACAEPERNEVESRFLQALGRPGIIVTMAPEGHVILAAANDRIELAPTSSTNGG